VAAAVGRWPRRWGAGRGSGGDPGAAAAASAHAPEAIVRLRARNDITDQNDTADRIAATLRNDPIDRIEKAEPIEPIDPTDPTLNTERIEPELPIDRIESRDPRLRTDGADARRVVTPRVSRMSWVRAMVAWAAFQI
jgi:hypothetical protein